MSVHAETLSVEDVSVDEGEDVHAGVDEDEETALSPQGGRSCVKATD